MSFGFAAAVLTRCRSSQRTHRNTLVFAAADEAALGAARSGRQVPRLGFHPQGQYDPRAAYRIADQGRQDRARTTKDAAEKAIRSAWTHILFAQKEEGLLDGKPFDLAQTTLLARDRPSIASVYEKLSSRGDSIVKDTLGPRILMAKLGPLWPKERPHLPIAEVREWFSAYVYLPKLRDSAVLDGAITEGISTSDSQFGYATGFVDATGRYEGLVYGRLAPPSAISRHSPADLQIS